MLAGEYAVLKGGAALASTIDAYLTVSASTTIDAGRGDGFLIDSDLWPEPVHLSSSDSIPSSNHSNPLLETVRFGMEKFGLKNGSIKVTSKLAINYGVGSSSAIRLGVLFAMNALRKSGEPSDQELRWELARYGFKLQKLQQSFASGYDFATQLLGGTVLLRSPSQSPEDWPGMIGRFSSLKPGLQTLVHPFVGGSGAPTKSVTIETMDWLTSHARWQALSSLSEELVEAFVAALGKPESDSTNNLTRLCAEHRQLFAGSPHQPKHLFSRLEALPGCNKSWGFKTTGAGGEDALLLVGHDRDLSEARLSLEQAGWEKLPFSFSNEPIQVEKETLH
jgi:mevalonate kinase